MFGGTCIHKIDSKRRITLPAEYRSHFADGIFINKGLDDCLTMYTMTQAQIEMDKVAKLDDNIPSNRRYKRLYYSGVLQDQLDTQGRIQLPQDLIDYADLGKEVRIIGAGDRIEIWNKEAWEAYQNEAETHREELAEETSRSQS